jgi:hypothetical protein
MKERISVMIVCNAVCVPDKPKGQGGIHVNLASSALRTRNVTCSSKRAMNGTIQREDLT